MGSLITLGRWATLYWAAAVVLGFAVVVAYHRHRARSVGVQNRVWPTVAVGVELLALVALANGEGRAAIPDFWIRGTGALLIIAIGISVLAVLERSRPFAAFAAGFFALSLLSCLYDDVNILQRVGLAGPFQTSANALPNLLLPGLYLVLGGLSFLIARGGPLISACAVRCELDMVTRPADESPSSPTNGLDDVVHQRARLGILTVVHEARRVEFGFLLDTLRLTAGNLSQHLRVLEDAGFIRIDKGIEGRRPRTWVSITGLGRHALLKEIAALKAIVSSVEDSVGAAE